ncbi:hypothetical protein HPU229334_04205 [Helicobacter pullorum]|uniref:Uncharacterized protein n=1 Tax=Helicobacter pullorum TaxID=35818 RepID=A0A0N0LR81_9HELI|nr:hypothetical protein [Helicobacter pullorum]KPH51741.1 hypothetical protein HPU229334_04205 [Helicobacter pullorum]
MKIFVSTLEIIYVGEKDFIYNHKGKKYNIKKGDILVMSDDYYSKYLLNKPFFEAKKKKHNKQKEAQEAQEVQEVQEVQETQEDNALAKEAKRSTRSTRSKEAQEVQNSSILEFAAQQE